MIIFFIIIKKINLMINYCNTRIFPEEPNDCVFFSTNEKKCCFNPNNKTRCFEESSEDGLLCQEDYFYNFMKGQDKYEAYKNKRGYCTFSFGNIKGAFEYDEKVKKVLKIKEVKKLEVKCLNSKYFKLNIFIFFLFFIL